MNPSLIKALVLLFYDEGNTDIADGNLNSHSDLRRAKSVNANAVLQREVFMSCSFKCGDHVSWNSEAGRVSGKIVAVHTQDFEYKGHTRRASPDQPQYEIASDKTDHIAAHKADALRKLAN
jgi:hypothetical protein